MTTLASLRRSFPHRVRLPVFAAPMFLVSGPELVIAACKAGIVGAFPAPNARPIAELDRWMGVISGVLAQARVADPQALIGPWAVNLITHSTNARLRDDLALVAKHQPPIVITALGSPRPAIEVVKSYGGIVIGDVVNLKLARKAVEAGVDGLACIAAGAGGHTGALSPFAFVSAVREFFDGLIVLGGGISDGAGVAGAIAAGANFVYMGTRFIAASESLALSHYKQMVAQATLDDLIVSAGITGTPASWLKPSLRENGLDPDTLPPAPEKHYDAEGNAELARWTKLWSAGQGVGAVKRVEPIGVMVDRLAAEFDAARARLSAWRNEGSTHG